METIIEFKNVRKCYGGKRAIDNFSLCIDKGDFLCVVGTSGSGKTTIMKMINGLHQADAGDVCVRHKNIKEENLIELRRSIGYAIQGNGLFPHMTVFDNIAYVPSLSNDKTATELKEIVEEMMQLVGLPLEMANRYPDELSGGQQQRVGIARAYANRPDILLMDEPFGAVDSITRYQLQKELKRIHQKTQCTVVFITHDIAEAFKMATHILVLDEGQIEQFGTVEEVKQYPATEFVRDLLDMTE